MKDLVIKEIREALKILDNEQNRVNNAFVRLGRLFYTHQDACVECGYTQASHPVSYCNEFVKPINISDLRVRHKVYVLRSGRALNLDWEGLNLSYFNDEEKINIIENLDEVFLNCLKAIQEEIQKEQEKKTTKIDEYIELLKEESEQ
jgi:hypothetical protein